MTERRDLGLYLHIPFCHARCGYCDFVSLTGQDGRVGEYLAALGREAASYGPLVGNRPIQTLFLGGGTPSVLSGEALQSLLDTMRRHFRLEPDAEITLEANPESTDASKAAAWRRAGVNRVSLGFQSFDDGELRALGRLHNAAEGAAAFRRLREAGFDNLSLDLMYGLPGQDLASWQRSVRAAVALGPEHLSIYALSIEPKTPFGARGLRVNDDLQADQYGWARGCLADAGYEQYEISNFARAGRACRHNLIYWRQQDYLGLGLGAVGCLDGVRWQNHAALAAYGEAVAQGRLPRQSEERLDVKTLQFERLMLGLRLREGVPWVENGPEPWRQTRDRLAKEGLLEEISGGRWRIPGPVVPLTNQVLLPFVP